MAVEKTAEEYRQRADEMKLQVQRAETVYLQAIYSSIADNWDRLAEQMRAAERQQQQPPPQKAAKGAAARPS
jgi:hypothetical protein